MAALDSRKIVTITFLPKQECDKLSDEIMGEIARRIVATAEDSSDFGNLWVNPVPPSDLSRLWLAQDPVTALPVGAVKRYNPGSGTWEDVAILTETQVVSITPGVQTEELEITGDGTFGVNWGAPYASNSYILSPYAAGDPAGASWYVSSKSVAGATITVTGWTANFTINLNASGILA